MGLLLAVVVHPANIQDRDGAKLVIDKLIGRFPRMRLVWADAGYAGKLVEWVWAGNLLYDLEVGDVVLPCRFSKSCSREVAPRTTKNAVRNGRPA